MKNFRPYFSFSFTLIQCHYFLPLFFLAVSFIIVYFDSFLFLFIFLPFFYCFLDHHHHHHHFFFLALLCFVAFFSFFFLKLRTLSFFYFFSLIVIFIPLLYLYSSFSSPPSSLIISVQSAEAVEYADCILAEGQDTTPISDLYMSLNHWMVRLQFWSIGECEVPFIAINLWSTLMQIGSTN